MKKRFFVCWLFLFFACLPLLVVVGSDDKPNSEIPIQNPYVPSSIDNFFDVTSSGETFWIVGSDGVLIKVEKPKKLKEIKINTHEDLLSVSYSDPDHGWIVGTNGLILKTTDGGNNWIKVDPGINPTKLNLLTVKAISPDTILIGGEKGSVLRSTDGGTTWSNISIQEDVNISLVDHIAGYLVAGGEFGSLFIHKNNKWKKITINKFVGDDWMNPEIVSGITDLGRDKLGVVGSTGNTYVFNLKRESVESAKDVKVPLYSVSKSNNYYIACGEFGKIFYSGDFNDWTEARKDVELNIFIRSVSFLGGDLSRGLAVGGYGTIMITNDGGKTWARI